MVIDGKLPQGYVVICNRGHAARSFLVERLGLSVECPGCGCTALSVDLAAAFHGGSPHRITPPAGRLVPASKAGHRPPATNATH